jgi:hypothetical protein
VSGLQIGLQNRRLLCSSRTLPALPWLPSLGARHQATAKRHGLNARDASPPVTPDAGPRRPGRHHRCGPVRGHRPRRCPAQAPPPNPTAAGSDGRRFCIPSAASPIFATCTISLGICPVRAPLGPDLQSGLSVSDRERPLFAEANGPANLGPTATDPVPCFSPILLDRCHPSGRATVSKLAKRPRSGLALTRRTRPRSFCCEEDDSTSL